MNVHGVLSKPIRIFGILAALTTAVSLASQLVAARAQVKGRIAEVELQIIQIDQDLRSEVAAELADIGVKSSELGERKIAAEDQLNRIAGLA